MVTFNRNIPSWDGKHGNKITQWESPHVNDHGRPIEAVGSAKAVVWLFALIVMAAGIVGIVWGMS